MIKFNDSNPLFPIVTQLIRFGTVGVASTFVNTVMFLFLVDFFKIQPLIGNLVAFLFAFLVSYFGHSHWTFKNKSHSKERLVKFLITSLLGLLINSSFVWLVMHHYHLSAYIAILPMIFITPLLIFFINKFWVFKMGVE